MSTQPNTNPSPKLRFMAVTKLVQQHRELMQRADLQISLDYALLEYQHQVCLRTNEQMAGAGHLRILGVMEFLNVLKTLAESFPTPTIVDRDNLKKV